MQIYFIDNNPMGGGGTQYFKWLGGMKDVFGFEIHDFGIFWGSL